MKKINRGSVVVGLCLLGLSWFGQADTLQQQRQRYQEIKQAWDKKDMQTVGRLLPTLRQYPLYPYLEYRWLTDDISLLSFGTAQKFVEQHPTLPPARTLANRFIIELARRGEWRSILTFSPQPPTATESQCHYYYAKWVTGQAQEAWQGAEMLWLTGKSLPTGCDVLFNAWQGSRQRKPSLVLERIRLAFSEDNTGLVNHLVRQLPQGNNQLVAGLTALQKNPGSVDNFARSVGPDELSRTLTLVAFNRYTKQDAERARSLIPSIVRAQKMAPAEQLKLEESVASRWMNSTVTWEQAHWRDQVIARSQDSALIERRIRLALGEGNRQSVGQWLSRLPQEERHKDEWVYWQAVIQLEGAQQSEAKAALSNLMQKRGFYPMAAALKLKQAYPVNVSKAAKPTPALEQSAEIARVRELMYWNLDNQARSEWRNLVEHSAPAQQEALARYALEQRWADLSVQATITAKLWDHLEERFPLAWESYFNQMTRTKNISTSYAMAIARQESAWNPQAQSPVGASGLMQIMPKTAEHTVKMYGIPGYTSSSQLFDPRTNIEIGTFYLNHVYQTFGGNRILASAAYNAGPSRVKTWLNNSGGRIDAIAFVESIPFTETRNYVKNVLAYDVFYRYFMKEPLALLTDNEWNRRY